MTTTVTKTIRASGGDYTTLSAWEAAQQGNLTTLDEIHVAECYDDWASGLADSVVIGGSTTDANRYMKVTVAANNAWCDSANGGKHALKTDSVYSGFTLKTTVNSAIIKTEDAYTIVERVRLCNTNTGAYCCGVQNTASAGVVCRKLDCDARTGFIASASLLLHSSLLQGSYHAIDASTYINAVYVYSSAFINSPTGFYLLNGLGDCLAKNCVWYNCTTDCSRASTGLGYNATTQASPGTLPSGTGNVFDVVSTDFVDPSTGDFHLSGTGSALYNAGANLSSIFTTDIDGDTWANWSIGFDQVAAGGVQSFSYSAGGGMTLGGTATRAMGHTPAPAGGVSLGGTSAEIRGHVPAPSSGIFLAGAASEIRGRVPTPSGGLQTGGTAAEVRGHNPSPSGGVAFSGAAAEIRGHTPAPSGGVIFGGHATYSSSGTQTFDYTPAGGLSLSGIAATIRSVARAPSGGFSIAGAASAIWTYIGGFLVRNRLSSSIAQRVELQSSIAQRVELQSSIAQRVELQSPIDMETL